MERDMDYNFTKMSGTGNDFILIDNRDGFVRDARDVAIKFCKRRLSIGADGLLLLEESQSADVRMRYLNADGSEVEMCGNGARCISHFAHSLGYPSNFNLQTAAGVLPVWINGDVVKIGMPEPHIEGDEFSLEIDGETYSMYSANTGVPHQVIFVDDLQNIDVNRIGRAIRYHDRFAPRGTNVDFAKVINRSNIALRTYERGVESETLSCGTGAVASILIGGKLGLIDSPGKAHVKLPDTMVVDFDDEFKSIFLTGRVEITFTGRIDYP
jgi:diaminopimelate epimerase